MCVTWLILVFDMTHSCVWHDSFIRVTWLILCVTWLTHMSDMTHSCVWHDSLIRVNSFMCVTWLIHMCDMTHSSVWHNSSICLTWLIDSRDRLIHMWHDTLNIDVDVTWHIYKYDMTLKNVWHDSFTCATLLIRVQKLGICRNWDLQKLGTCRNWESAETGNQTLFQNPRSRSQQIGFSAFITWLITVYDMTYGYVRPDSCMCDMTHSATLQHAATRCNMLLPWEGCCWLSYPTAWTPRVCTHEWISTSHHISERVMTHKSETWHVWLIHLPHIQPLQQVITDINKSSHISTSHDT